MQIKRALAFSVIFLGSLIALQFAVAAQWSNVPIDTNGNYVIGGNLNASGTITIGGIAVSTSTATGGAATTTINGVQAAIFTIATGSPITFVPSGTSTFTIGCITCLTTSTFNATGTAFYFHIWNASGNGISATSSLFQSSSTGSVGIGTTNPDSALSIANGALSINPDVAADEFQLGGRLAVGIPVPYVSPMASTTAIAFDIFPKGPNVANGFGSNIFGAAWQDICSTDLNSSSSANYECLHLGKSVNGYANVSTEQAGTGLIQPLELQANGGNVGIGTSNPQALLDVGGLFTPFGINNPFSNSSPTVAISSNVGGTGGVAMTNVSTSTFADFRFILQDTTGHYFAFAQPGVNNTSTLFGSLRNSSDFIFNNNGVGGARNITIGTVSPNTALILGTNNIERVRIASSGFVGIGTAQPSSTLQVDSGLSSSTIMVGDATHYGCIEYGTPAGLVYQYATTTAPFIIATTTKPNFACQ